MALTDDNSRREMYFDGGMPVKDTKKYESLKNLLKNTELPTAVSRHLISEIFSPLKDIWTNMTITTSAQQFERWCKSHGWPCRYDVTYDVYLVNEKS